MSERNKTRLIYTLIITSLALNLLLMVNVFALKLVSKRHQAMQPSMIDSSQSKITEQFATKNASNTKEELTPSKKILLQTSHELALNYEQKAEKAITLHDKVDFYSLALLQYSKLPKQNPYYAKLARQARERIQPQMLELSTPLVALGDSRDAVEQIYGKPDRQVVDAKYLPSGTITYDHYISQGLIIGMSMDRVFSIKLGSHSPGLWHGIQVGDNFDKIKTLYKGKKVERMGSNFAYKADKLNTTFVFIDKDNKLDSIEISDNQYYGTWRMALK